MDLPYTTDEWEWLYGLWSIWRATGKRFLPSQLIHEQLHYGRALSGVLDMEGFYGKLMEDLKAKKPNGQ